MIFIIVQIIDNHGEDLWSFPEINNSERLLIIAENLKERYNKNSNTLPPVREVCKKLNIKCERITATHWINLKNK